MDVKELSGSTLAYLGDAVWSLLVREYLISKGYAKAKDLQERSVSYVSAKAQAAFMHQLMEENYFTDHELEVFKRGRNFKSDSVPKNTDVQTYRVSTGFEAVFGYWHFLGQQDRVMQTWDRIRTLTEE